MLSLALSGMYADKAQTVCGLALLITFIGSNGMNIVRTLRVRNGRHSGTWTKPVFCPHGSLAYGAKLQMTSTSGNGEATFTDICLKCKKLNGDNVGFVEPYKPNGNWNWQHSCPKQDQYLVAFRLQIQEQKPRESKYQSKSKKTTKVAHAIPLSQSGLKENVHVTRKNGKYKTKAKVKRDVTFSNSLRFLCATQSEENVNINQQYLEKTKWSPSCPQKSAICGMTVKSVNNEISENATFVTDIKFHCCKQSPIQQEVRSGCTRPANNLIKYTITVSLLFSYQFVI